MKTVRIFIWIITFMWMGIIFYFSSQPVEVSLNSSGKILVTLDKLEEDEVQNVTDRRVFNLQNTIRKHAHFIVYSILGFLMAFSFIFIRHKNLLIYFYAWFASSLYGVSDEIHQSLVPGRGMMLSDMLLDSMGALAGTIISMLIIEGWKLIRKRRAVYETQ